MENFECFINNIFIILAITVIFSNGDCRPSSVVRAILSCFHQPSSALLLTIVHHLHLAEIEAVRKKATQQA